MANKLNGKLLLAYIAGIIDGEGCIMIHSNLVRVAVKNTNEWLIKFLKMNFGGCLVYQKHSWGNPRSKPIWSWQVDTKKACEFLQLILPYLQIKRPQAELVLSFQKRRTGEWRKKGLPPEIKMLDDIDKSLMHKMNQRGL